MKITYQLSIDGPVSVLIDGQSIGEIEEDGETVKARRSNSTWRTFNSREEAKRWLIQKESEKQKTAINQSKLF